MILCSVRSELMTFSTFSRERQRNGKFSLMSGYWSERDGEREGEKGKEEGRERGRKREREEGRKRGRGRERGRAGKEGWRKEKGREKEQKFKSVQVIASYTLRYSHYLYSVYMYMYIPVRGGLIMRLDENPGSRHS